MGSQDNIKIVRELMQAVRNGDEARYGELLTEDAVLRVAGVPRSLGGVIQGRDQILANFRQQGPPSGDVDVRSIFADEDNVCAVTKISGPFEGNEHFRGTGRPFSTYQCSVFNLKNGSVREQTLYTNFLDIYVQAGLVQLGSLIAQGQRA